MVIQLLYTQYTADSLNDYPSNLSRTYLPRPACVGFVYIIYYHFALLKMPLLIHSQTHKNHAVIHYSMETLVSTLRTHNQLRYKAYLNLAIFFPPLLRFTTLSMNIKGNGSLGNFITIFFHQLVISSNILRHRVSVVNFST